MGTNLNGGGLSVFIETNNPNSETRYEFYDVGLHGWTWAWAPFIMIKDNMFGPYKTKGKLIKPENKIEEAPNWVETDYIYWSENDSNVGSFIRRAKIDIESDNSLTTIKDLNFKVEWMLAATTTHPDMTDDGKLRATIRDRNNFV